MTGVQTCALPIFLEEYTRTGSKSAAKKHAGDKIADMGTETSHSQLSDFIVEVEHIMSLFDAYKERFQFDETLLIEAPLEVQLPKSPHILIGRPDRVVRYQGKMWHVQNRTLSDRTVMPVYLAAAERDLHELAYAHLISGHFQLHSDGYGGTIMNICRKVSKKKLAEDPDAAFVQELIPINPAQVADAIEDIVQVATDMAAVVEGRRRIVQNRDTDKGRFGNRLSPFFGVRTGRVTLYDDELFKAAESRYDTETVDA